MEHVVAEMPQNLEYVVQEKVHGTNTSFLCDGMDVGFAKRTSTLAESEQFYDYPELVARYKERVLKLFAEPVPYSEALQVLIVEGEAYVTENRLANVVSHIGEVHFPKDFGKVMGLLSKDVLDDFLKKHGGSYSALDKCEQKSLNKELNKLCTALVKQVYMSQAYIME